MSEIFRDRSEGANARRLDLLRRRRDELITMPHAVRRVFVARSARIAASLVVCVGGMLMIAAAAIPPVGAAFERVLPGVNPATLSQILLGTWIAALFVYFLARARGEHRFIVAMSRYVLPGDDVDHDIERLSHEHPDAMAKEMAQRLEVRSAAWPVVAAVLVLPATAGYVTDSIITRGWSRVYEYHLAANSWWLVGLGLGATLCGLLMTRRFARVPAVAPIAALVALLAIAAVPVFVMNLGVAPMWLTALAGLSLTAAIVARRLRAERELIDATDPTAGSKLYTLRDAIDFVKNLRGRVRKTVVIPVAAAATLLVLAGSPLMASTSTTAAKTIATPTVVQPSAVPAPVPVAAPVETMAVQSTAEVGRITEIKGIAGFETLPAGWTMTVVVKIDDAPGLVDVNPFIGDAQPSYDNGTQITTITISGCSGPMPLGLRIEPKGKKDNRPVTVRVEPKLAYDCKK